MIQSRPWRAFLLASAAIAVPVSGLQAQPGSLDPAFDGDGRALLDVGEVDVAYAVALEPDGSVVAFGSTETAGDPGSREGLMLRFAAGGEVVLTRTYPSNGFGCSAPLAFFSAERQPDGEFLVGGYRQTDCSGVERDFVVRRLDAAGGLQQAFDPPTFQGATENARAAVVAPDGTVVAAGWSSLDASNTGIYDIAIARWLADGALDPSFSDDGELRVDIAGDYDFAYDLAVDASGRILACGFSRVAGQLDLLLLRLQADGTPDPAFGDDGVLLMDFEGLDDTGRSLALDAQGRILVAVQSDADSGNARRMLVLRLLADGAPDLAFGAGGVAQVGFGTDAASPAALALDSLGRILVAGTRANLPGDEASQDFAIAVLDDGGQPLAAFGTAGVQTVGFTPGPSDVAMGLAVDEGNRRLAVVGYSGMRDPDDVLLRDVAVAVLEGPPGAAIFSDGFEDPAAIP